MDEPNIIPEFEMLGPSTGHAEMIARFHCPIGCGWRHDEPADPGPGRIILPVGFTATDLSGAMSLNAEAGWLAFRSRVEAAITDHFETAHPGY
ncbi:hypothetical protein ACWEO1_22680 [Kitasatospora cineracea]